MTFRIHHLVASLLLTLGLSNLCVAQSKTKPTWPQWRGPNRDGHVPGKTFADKPDLKGLEKAWDIPLGPSYSGPIVGDKLVYTTETVDKKRERVSAYSRETGKKVWSTSWKGAMSVPFFAASNGSWIRSTPALADGRLFVAGIRDVLVCLNAADGKEIWRVDFPRDKSTPPPAFGFVCSPLIRGSDVFVQAGAALHKLDAATGKIAWKALSDEGGMNGSAFSSPLATTLGGRTQLLVQTRTTLAGLTLDKGEVLWSQEIPAFRGMNILTPVSLGDRVFTSSYGGGTLAFDIGSSKDGKAVESFPAWKDSAQGYMSTPVIVKKYAYLHLRNQRMTCFDLATGAREWTTSERFGKYMSLVVQQETILALDERGELLLITATPTAFELRDRRRVTESGSSTWAHLAVAGDQIFVRRLNGLSVLRWSK